MADNKNITDHFMELRVGDLVTIPKYDTTAMVSQVTERDNGDEDAQGNPILAREVAVSLPLIGKCVYINNLSGTVECSEYSAFGSGGTSDVATATTDGLMSATDKAKLDGLSTAEATTARKGLMSAGDKLKLDGLTSVNVTPQGFDKPRLDISVTPEGVVTINNCKELLEEGNVVHVFRWCKTSSRYKKTHSREVGYKDWHRYGKGEHKVLADGTLQIAIPGESCESDYRMSTDIREVARKTFSHDKEIDYVRMGKSKCRMNKVWGGILNGEKVELSYPRAITFRVGIAIGKPNPDAQIKSVNPYAMLTKMAVVRLRYYIAGGVSGCKAELI